MKIFSFLFQFFVSWEYTISADVNECLTGQHNCGDVSRCRNTDGSYYCLCPGKSDIGTSSANYTLAWGDSCYSITHIWSNRKNWEDARLSCKANSGDLVVIGTREEQDWIITQIRRLISPSMRIRQWWYGLHKPEDNSEWTWVDGTSLNNRTITWALGEPNGGNRERCVEVWETGTLNDNSCTETFPYICEYNTAVDKCEDEEPCDTNAECMNIPGGYTCTCNSGYFGDGFNCTDYRLITGVVAACIILPTSVIGTICLIKRKRTGVVATPAEITEPAGVREPAELYLGLNVYEEVESVYEIRL